MKEKMLNLAQKLLVPLILMSISRLIFHLENIEYFNFDSLNQIIGLTSIAVRLDLVMVLLVNIVFIVGYFLFSNQSRISKIVLRLIYVVPNTLLLLINLIDVFYYPYIFKRINPSFFDYLATQKNMGSLNIQFLTTYWYGLIALVVFIFVLNKVFNTQIKITRNFKTKSYFKEIVVGLVILMAVSSNYNPTKGIIRSNEVNPYLTNPHQKALVLNTGYNILEQTLFPIKQDEHLFTYKKDIHFNRVGQELKPNVVLLVLESFAHEASALLNSEIEKGYMPFLDSLMQKGYYFTNAFSNGRQSMDAIPAIWNSLPAQEVPFILKDPGSTSFFGLPKVLKQQGYSTHFFHGAQNGSMDFDRYAKQNHIDNYYGLQEYPKPKQDFDGTWGVWDEPFLQHTQTILDEVNEPFFSTVFTLSSHNPCKVPLQYENQFEGGDLDIYKSIEYSDYALRQFFESAKTKSWYKNTLFVITADHSIHPNSKKYASAESSFAIPLLFFSDDTNFQFQYKTTNRLAQHIDIFPSIMHVLKLKADQPFSIGNNLFCNQSNHEVLNYYNGIYQFQTTDSTYLFSTESQSNTNHRNVLEDYLSNKTGLNLSQISN